MVFKGRRYLVIVALPILYLLALVLFHSNSITQDPPFSYEDLIFVSVVNINQFQQLRLLINSIQIWEPGKKIEIYSINLTQDQCEEIGFYLNTRLFHLKTNNHQREALLASRKNNRNSFVILVPVDYQLVSRLCGLERYLQMGFKVNIGIRGCWQANSPVEGICILFRQYFSKQPSKPETPCNLLMPPIFPPPLYPQKNWTLEKFCICIPVYNDRVIDVYSQSVLMHTLPTLKKSLLNPELFNIFEMVVYLGSQVGDYIWDNQILKNHTLDIIKTLFNSALVHFETIRYPLNPGLANLAFKYNMLMNQAYVDRCDYILIMCDDVDIIDKSLGWPILVANSLKKRHKLFGVAAPHTEKGLMLCPGIGRGFIDVLGQAIPTRLQNWFLDDYLHDVLGPKYLEDFAGLVNISHPPTIKERYPLCTNHRRVQLEEMYVAQKK